MDDNRQIEETNAEGWRFSHLTAFFLIIRLSPVIIDYNGCLVADDDAVS